MNAQSLDGKRALTAEDIEKCAEKKGPEAELLQPVLFLR